MPDTVEDALEVIEDCCYGDDSATPIFHEELATIRAELTRLRTEVAALSEPVGDGELTDALALIEQTWGDSSTFDAKAVITRALTTAQHENADLRKRLERECIEYHDSYDRLEAEAQRDKERMEAVAEALTRANAEHDLWVSTGSDNAYDAYESAVWEAINAATLEAAYREPVSDDADLGEAVAAINHALSDPQSVMLHSWEHVRRAWRAVTAHIAAQDTALAQVEAALVLSDDDCTCNRQHAPEQVIFHDEWCGAYSAAQWRAMRILTAAKEASTCPTTQR